MRIAGKTMVGRIPMLIVEAGAKAMIYNNVFISLPSRPPKWSIEEMILADGRWLGGVRPHSKARRVKP